LVEPVPNRKQIEEDYKLIPHNGVYVVKSIINQKPFWNDEHRVQPHCIGRETVDRSFFFDFDTDFDQKIKVSILKYIRTEKKFDSVDLLTKQLEKIKVLQLLIYKNFNFYYKILSHFKYIPIFCVNLIVNRLLLQHTAFNFKK
jgi:hypothetical protein